MQWTDMVVISNAVISCTFRSCKLFCGTVKTGRY